MLPAGHPCSCCTPVSPAVAVGSWASAPGGPASVSSAAGSGSGWSMPCTACSWQSCSAAELIDRTRAYVDASHIRAGKRGRGDRPAGRPPQDRTQAPPDQRRRQHPLPRDHHRRQRQRRHPDPPLVDAVPAVAGRVGHRRKCHILSVIFRRRERDVIGLGKLRYVVEQAFAQLHQFKRLAVRWERRLDLHNTFVSLACALIYW